MPRKLDAFTLAYIEAMLWSSTDNADEQGGEPLDKNYSADDIAPETMELIVEDCADFQERYADLLSDSGIDDDRAGHCFWLSREGHGSGFFDEDSIDEEFQDPLQESAQSYGSFDLQVDDGVIYGPPAEWYREHRKPKPVASEARRARHVVRDFGTLPELVEHAGQQDGATHVVVLGKKASLFYPTGRYWPSGEPQYEAGKVWHQGGYWHSVAPSARSPLTGGLPGGAEPIEAYLTKTGQRAVEAKRRRRAEMTPESALELAGELAQQLGGSEPRVVPGGYRWTDKNESAQFTTYSPEYGQKVVVVVSVFTDGSTAILIFSDEHLSSTAQYENISSFTYKTADVTEMVKDVRWVWETVDGYAASWQEGEGGEVDEARQQNLYVWQISLQVTSPERPNLRHEIQYRVQALSGDREGAVAKAKAIAERDGHTVIGVTGAARGYRVRTETHETRSLRETWVPPNLARDGITPTMLEVLIGGVGGLARIRPGKSVVYDRAYAELRDGGYVVLMRATPGTSPGGDYYALTDKGADLVRRYRLEIRKAGASWGSKVSESSKSIQVSYTRGDRAITAGWYWEYDREIGGPFESEGAARDAGEDWLRSRRERPALPGRSGRHPKT
jgi:hypothetical protein